MRIATYNLNNLFQRAAVLQLDGFSPVTREVLNDVTKLQQILDKTTYATADKQQILHIVFGKYTVDGKQVPASKYFFVNEIKNKLISKSRGAIRVIANGKADWYGWIEFTVENVKDSPQKNTALVIDTVNADIMCTVEVDNRIALDKFNSSLIPRPFQYNMLIDGNDDRGIDVGVYSRFEIVSMQTHIADTFMENNKPKLIFSRDCAIYSIKVKGNKLLHLFCNHLKSQGYGSKADNDAKRKRQADRVSELANRFDLANDYVVIAGDFNDNPDSVPVKSLYSLSGLHDVVATITGDRGTFERSKNTFDNLLVSSALFKKLNSAFIERSGIFENKTGVWFNTVTSKANQASDHACVYADFQI